MSTAQRIEQVSEPAPYDDKFFALVKADLTRLCEFQDRSFPSVVGLVDVLLLSGTWSVLLYRIAHALQKRMIFKVPARLVFMLNIALTGADLNAQAQVGPGLIIGHPVGIGWGNGLRIGTNVMLTGQARFGMAASRGRKGHPLIGDECILFDGAKVMGPVTVGTGAVLATNALVLDDVPDGAVMVGQPAKFLRWRDEDEVDADH